ncbi:exocyst complex component 2 isoform X7 [Phascolarctos cinereus]
MSSGFAVGGSEELRGSHRRGGGCCGCGGGGGGAGYYLQLHYKFPYSMSRSRQPPLVTGISPNEGISWTKVTIRGENLGTGPTDLIGLTICGHNCLLTAEWMSASKIVCRVGQAKNDKGDIIVTTKSGGKGTSTVSFKLLKPEKIGILDQSAVWVDEMNYYDMRTDRNKGIPPLSLRPANPLGIEIEKSKFPQKDLETLFHGMSADFTSENFSAAWYLIENHSTTSFEQLKMAVSNLKKQANKKNEGSLAYVKGGLSTFFEAQDALSAIHQKLEADGTEKVEGSMTQKLENVLNRASNTADTLFQEVLGRKDKADSTRNALNVLQRFKFLFNLPLNIERNIQKGDYDVVINDYEKAKSLFGKTEVQVFKKYYAEVETRIEDLRELLLDKLLETPSTLHDQKRYIRYLSDLHADGDPSWQCIGAQHKWILQLMHSCKENYVKDLKGNTALHSPMLELDNDMRPSALAHLSQTASLKRASSFQSGRDDTWRYKAPHRVAFVEKLTKLVLSQLPNFWKLWISYVNGSLFSETAEKSGQMERSKNARQRQHDFKKMIQEVMYSLVKLIRGSLLPFSLKEGELRQYGGWEMKSELSGQWLTHVIQTVRLTYESLTALEIPNDLLQNIQDLILDLRVRCIMITLQHTAEDVKRLAEKEDWIVDNEGLTSLVSMASLKELDQRLFENYIELKADPIVGSLEPGIYAGYFDWKDCLTPTGVRNYLKEALVNIIAVHAEVFTISKELVPRVLSKIVEAVSEELSRLMQCVSSFSKNGALQARLEICALRDTVAVYLTPESKSSFKQALEALPQLSSGADKKLLEELLNKFKSRMHLQLTCFQASPSPMLKT